MISPLKVAVYAGMLMFCLVFWSSVGVAAAALLDAMSNSTAVASAATGA